MHVEGLHIIQRSYGHAYLKIDCANCVLEIERDLSKLLELDEVVIISLKQSTNFINKIGIR